MWWFRVVTRSMDLPNASTIILTDKPVDPWIPATFNMTRIRVVYNRNGLRI